MRARRGPETLRLLLAPLFARRTAAAPAIVLVPFLAVALALGLALVRWGNVFPDEGWYLHAGQLVTRGLAPYRDFAFFQAPLAAHLFALVDGSFVGGRLLCLGLGLAAIGLALDLARRRGWHPLLWTAALLVPATYTLRWYSVSRNIAPAAFLIMLGVWLHARLDRRLSWLAAVPIALAAGIRLSAVGALAALVVCDWLRPRDEEPGAGHPGRTAIAAAVALAAILGPFLVSNPDLFVFNNLVYHTGLHASGDLGSLLLSKIQGLAKLFEHHHLLALVLVLALVGDPGAWLSELRNDRTIRLAAATFLSVTGLHLIPGQLHPEYHELVLPQLALVAGSGSARLVMGPRLRVLVALLIITGLVGARSQLWALKGWQPSRIAELGERVARLTPADGLVLTFVPDVAIHAGRRLWPGLEMASVSLARPDLAEASCRRYHMVNLAMLARHLERGGPHTVVWRRLEDADPRRVRLYAAAERRRVGQALAVRYERADDCYGWEIWTRSKR